jgi:hypothetical protein
MSVCSHYGNIIAVVSIYGPEHQFLFEFTVAYLPDGCQLCWREAIR